MIVAMAWKEYREHRVIWLVMLALGLGLVWVLPELLPLLGLSAVGHGSDLGTLPLAALGAVVTYGVVCGAMMLAGEREGNTLTFLEALAGRRWPVWRAKALAGAVLVLLQGLAVGASLAGALWLLGETSGPVRPAAWLAVLPLVALDAFAWGLLASALARSVLAAAGLGTACIVLAWFVAFVVSAVSPHNFLPARALLGVAGLAGSAWLFCGTDFRSAPAPALRPARLPPSAPRAERRVRPARAGGLRAVAWLTVRQGAALVLVMALAAVPAGMFLPATGPLLWLNLTLLVGVLCGTAVFGSEQSDGANRFLGDQRLPLGRVWAVKSALWLAAAVGVALLILAGSGLAVLLANLQSPPSVTGFRPRNAFLDSLLVGRPGAVAFLRAPVPAASGVVFLPLGLAYGFALGQFYALVWRKSVVAVFVALAASAGAVALWVPAVPWGGLSLWQVLVPPALLLAGVRLVLWPWAGSGLAAKKPALRLAGAAVLSVAWAVGVLGWRAVEVPDVGEPFDVDAYVAGLPMPEKNETSKIVRQAARDASLHRNRIEPELFQQLRPAKAAPRPDGEVSFPGWLAQAQEAGWPDNDRGLGLWLDRMFAGSWAADLKKELPQAPLGTVEDPRAPVDSSRNTLDRDVLFVASLLEGRAMQLQARGRPEEALDHLTLLLTLTRHLRHQATVRFWDAGVSAEGMALRGLGRWLAKVGPRKELLERARQELGRHEAEAAPASECLKAEYVRALSRTETPDALVRYVRPGPPEPAPAGEEELANASWQLPWEKERRRRILNAVYAAELRAAEVPPWEARQAAEGRPEEVRQELFAQIAWEYGLAPPDGLGAGMSPSRWGRTLYDSGLITLVGPPVRHHLTRQAQSQCLVRATRLQVALALYLADHGRPAESLGQLVPKYLAAVPTDPFCGRPFRYRVSQGGEKIRELSGDRPQDVPRGAGVVWSTGPDGTDHGGRRQWGRDRGAGPQGQPETGRDVIFLVPAWQEEAGR